MSREAVDWLLALPLVELATALRAIARSPAALEGLIDLADLAGGAASDVIVLTLEEMAAGSDALEVLRTLQAAFILEETWAAEGALPLRGRLDALRPIDNENKEAAWP